MFMYYFALKKKIVVWQENIRFLRYNLSRVEMGSKLTGIEDIKKLWSEELIGLFLKSPNMIVKKYGRDKVLNEWD